MTLNQSLEFISGCVSILQRALDAFDQRIGRPEFITEPGLERFRYKNPDSCTFQVIKCVRVISAYNASICLLREGYVQEVGALIRMILEFLHDIDFIQQGINSGQMTDKQKEMLTLFFQDDLRTSEQLLSTHSKRPAVIRSKVYALIAKFLNPKNPDRVQRIVRILEETYSGYIHGSYPHVMELYAGDSWRFYTKGMPDTPRHVEFIRALAKSLPQALNQFAEIAHSLGFNDLFTELVEKRKELETSELYARTSLTQST